MNISPILCGALTVGIFATLSSPQYTTPASMTACRLNYTAPFSWVVMIHDTAKKYSNNPQGRGGATQGAMLTHRAILTTATYFKVRHLNSVPFLFDYAIIVMEGYFNVTPPIFPTMFFPNTPYEMILNVQYVNVKNEEECAIPIPDNETLANREKLIINRRIDFATIKFHKECVNLICETLNGRRSSNCVQVLQNRPNATMLCALPAKRWTAILPWGPGEQDNPYAGTPYVCNGSTIGLVTQHKRRAGLPGFRRPRQDFFIIVTFVRIWAWLISELIEFSPKFTPFYIETANLKKETYQEPYKEPLPYRVPQGPQPRGPPFRYPNQKSAAVDKIRTISPVINAFFATIWMTF